MNLIGSINGKWNSRNIARAAIGNVDWMRLILPFKTLSFSFSFSSSMSNVYAVWWYYMHLSAYAQFIAKVLAYKCYAHPYYPCAINLTTSTQTLASQWKTNIIRGIKIWKATHEKKATNQWLHRPKKILRMVIKLTKTH